MHLVVTDNEEVRHTKGDSKDLVGGNPNHDSKITFQHFKFIPNNTFVRVYKNSNCLLINTFFFVILLLTIYKFLEKYEHL